MIERRKSEGVPINKSMQDIMIELARELKLGSFNFPFFADDRASYRALSADLRERFGCRVQKIASMQA